MKDIDECNKCDECGCFNIPRLICEICVKKRIEKDEKDLQGAYNIAMKEITRLRKLLGYDSPNADKMNLEENDG